MPLNANHSQLYHMNQVGHTVRSQQSNFTSVQTSIVGELTEYCHPMQGEL